MLRAIVGLIKGLVVGGAVGYGLLSQELNGSVMAYLACALVGALVGVVCGRPPWKAETFWTPVVKMIVGGVIGAGLCALGLKLLPERQLLTFQGHSLVTTSGAFLSLAVGVLYGIFVEVDDGGSKAEAKKSLPETTSKPRLKD